jgi:hypothetical protein
MAAPEQRDRVLTCLASYPNEVGEVLHASQRSLVWSLDVKWMVRSRQPVPIGVLCTIEICLLVHSKGGVPKDKVVNKKPATYRAERGIWGAPMSTPIYFVAVLLVAERYCDKRGSWVFRVYTVWIQGTSCWSEEGNI